MTAVASPPLVGVRLNRDTLARFTPPDGGWRDSTLPLAGGGLRVRTGSLGPKLSVTRSEARLSSDYHAQLEQSGTSSTLCFGRTGLSLFGFGGRDPSHVVRPGDVWLFHSTDAILSRWTPARVGARVGATMVAIKLPTERLAEVLDQVGVVREGTRAVRLGRTDPDRIDLGGLLDNPLVSPLDRLMAESRALALLAQWLAPLPGGADPDGRTGGPAADERERLAHVRDRLVSDLCHPPSLDQLAQEAGMSHARLNRCFRTAYGKTVFAWLRDYRLERACHHLRRDADSITDIAFLCGFSSSSHFAAAFRQRFGCCPAEYRRRTA